MNSERWQQIEDIFSAAMERAPSEQAALLDAACDGDGELRREVESLLAAHTSSADFLDQPLLEDKNNLQPAPSLIGKQLGRYRIVSLLGAGGMGEVYLARDVMLDRQIALKILPVQFAEDADQVRRFEREARAASALNHPNIITIHEIGQDAGSHFIATEFITGQTLRARLATGRMNPAEALKVAAQIASALAAAHAAGIVHRDIKPENVMVRDDGLVKLLDFGLAKPIESETTTGRLHKPSVASLQTDPSLLAGTLAYLSPEQASRQKLDHRTDIFSLGVVLYEMVAGRRPFGDGPEYVAQGAAATLDAIANQAPPPINVNHPALRVELERITNRALAKDRAARYQKAADLHDDLQRLARKLEAAEESGNEQGLRSGRSLAWLAKAAALLVAAGVSIAAWLIWREGASKSKDVSSPWIGAVSRKLTGYPGHEIFPSIAPDGQSFVYARYGEQKHDIFLQRVGEIQEARNLTPGSAGNDWMAAFSPDGARIAFRSDRDGGGIFVMDSDGGNLRRLTSEGYNPAWSPDGEEIVYTTSEANSPHSRSTDNSRLRAVKAATGEGRPIDIGAGKDAVQPSWSPNGARIAYWGLRGTQRDIWTVAARGGQPVAVTNDDATDWNPVWSPDGKYLYFGSDSHGAMRFWRVPIDQTTGRVLGEREAVTGSGAESWHPSFSRDGRRLVYVNYMVKENFYRIGFDPRKEVVVEPRTAITGGERRVTAPEISPDGQWLAYYTFGSPQEDLFIVRQDGSEPRQLTNDRRRDRVPRWSPDGRRLAFYSDRGGDYEIWAINVDGSGLRQITNRGGKCYYPAWSPDGTRLAFYGLGINTFIIEPDKPWAGQTPQPLPAIPGEGGHLALWSWSPDGEKLAGVWSNPGGKSSGGILTYSLASEQYERITDKGSDPVWLSDNRRLLFIRDYHLYLVDTRTKQPRQILSLDPLRITLATISRDDRQIYLSVISPESDIQMLTLN